MNHNGDITLPKAKSTSSFVAMNSKIANFVNKVREMCVFYQISSTLVTTNPTIPIFFLLKFSNHQKVFYVTKDFN